MPKSAPYDVLPRSWINFSWLPSQGCTHPCCLCTFSSQLPLIWIHTALDKQPAISEVAFYGLPSSSFVEGVEEHQLDNWEWECEVKRKYFINLRLKKKTDFYHQIGKLVIFHLIYNEYIICESLPLWIKSSIKSIFWAALMLYVAVNYCH